MARGYVHGREAGAARHEARMDNPHAVTAAQAGADPLGSAAAHGALRDNPHRVTAGQVPCAPWSSVLDAVSDINNQLNTKTETNYKWSKAENQEYRTNGNDTYVILDNVTSATKTRTVYYADAYAYDRATGRFTLVSPRSIEVSYNNRDSAFGLLRLKYIAATADPVSGVTYVSAASTLSALTSGAYHYLQIHAADHIGSRLVTLGYVYAAGRGAYPDDGWQGGYYYSFAGEFHGGMIPRLVTGSYVGTGTFGEAAPNTLELGFAPKCVIVIQSSSYGFSASNTGFVWVGQEDGNIKWRPGETSLSWYSKLDAKYQHNVSAVRYYYTAIG